VAVPFSRELLDHLFLINQPVRREQHRAAVLENIEEGCVDADAILVR
jgi:hypothetical protein